MPTLVKDSRANFYHNEVSYKRRDIELSSDYKCGFLVTKQSGGQWIGNCYEGPLGLGEIWWNPLDRVFAKDKSEWKDTESGE